MKAKSSKKDNPPLGPGASREWSLKERLEAIAAFAPVFDAPDFSPGELVRAKQIAENTWEAGWFRNSEEISQFISVCYQYGWVCDFDWVEWSNTKECKAFLDRPELIEKANALQLAKLLTTVMRREHFADGSVAEAFEQGVIRWIVERSLLLCADISREESR